MVQVLTTSKHVLDLVQVSRAESLLQWQLDHGSVLLYLVTCQIKWAGKAQSRSVLWSGVSAVSLSVPVRT